MIGEEGKMVKKLTRREYISTEFEEYENALFNKKLIRHKMNRIQSRLHKIAANDLLIVKDTF